MTSVTVMSNEHTNSVTLASKEDRYFMKIDVYSVVTFSMTKNSAITPSHNV